MNTGSALGDPKLKQRGMVGVVSRMAWVLLSNWVGGGYKKSVLFDADGKPRVEPRVLSADELADLKRVGVEQGRS